MPVWRPTWKQLVRFSVVAVLLGGFLFMFTSMGLSVIEHSGDPAFSLADLVTTYATFIAIIGLLVSPIIKDLFHDGD